jgi:hypothetical protein
MHRALIVLVTAVLVGPAAPASAQNFQNFLFCARANLPGGGLEGIVINGRLSLSPISDISTFSGEGINLTFGQPVSVWGACRGGQCSIGMKGTPVDGFPYVRESGGSFLLAGPFGGTLQVYEFLPGGSGQPGVISQYATSFDLSPVSGPLTSTALNCP